MSWHQLETARLLLELGHFVMEVYDRYVAYKESKEEERDHEDEPEGEVRYVTFLPLKGQEPEPDLPEESGASWLAVF